ncbi:hypothetical protein [Maribellus sp. YY47]|uniref:hypothetical protein n=1 Tax=Maribellus sp. YY47 TaxID=2929486 RepID=UPI002001347B|nr:hypothetical protein [Maribellus sp. YY47]MCK3685164.1 hypothetical protein [Maribellus sp. YY47]
MSYTEDFEQWKDAIANFPLEDVKLPNTPIDEYVVSVNTLAIDANEDRDVLAGAGMDVNLIDELTPLSGALSYLQAEWMGIFRARENAVVEWKEQSPPAFSFRDELLHDFSFAYRNREDVRKKVARIREGSSNADMVQDLLEIAVLGEKYPEPLESINFDRGKLSQARTLSHSLSELLAAANGAADDGNATKTLRDKAYSLLFQKDSTIREYGRYVFWKDEDRLSRYYR